LKKEVRQRRDQSWPEQKTRENNLTTAHGNPVRRPTKKTTNNMRNITCILTVATLCAAKVFATTPLGTAFTYQGKLNDSGVPANGIYDSGVRPA